MVSNSVCPLKKALMVGVFVTPRPGVPLRETWGWKPLLHTPSSGVWVLSGALQSIGFFGSFGCGCLLGWSQHLPHSLGRYVPWSRLPMLVFLRARPSYRAHTRDKVVGGTLIVLWRALAPLLSPWCADGDVPSAANLNLYEGSGSHVNWHCDDESLFGGYW